MSKDTVTPSVAAEVAAKAAQQLRIDTRSFGSVYVRGDSLAAFASIHADGIRAKLELAERIVRAVNSYDSSQATIRQLTEARDRYEKALREILSQVGGNDQLPGCEEFYRGYNSGLRTAKKIAEAVLAEVKRG